MNTASIWFSVLGFTVAACVAAALIVLWKKGYISADMIGTFGDMGSEVPGPQNELLATLIEYCRLAVQAVEQLVKSGQLAKNAEAKRDKAFEMVEQYANTEGVTLDDNSRNAIKSLIEVQVYQMQKENGDL